MPERLRILAYPADDYACGEYRVKMPARALQAEGVDVTVASDADGYLAVRTLDGGVVGAEPLDFDVLVLQRVMDWKLADAIPHWQANGVAVVVEIDDLVTKIPRDNSAWAAWSPARDPFRNFLATEAACARADLVTVTTPALARAFAPHGRVRVLPNCVPEAYLKTDPHGLPCGKTTVGWAGSVNSHRGDLRTIRGLLGEVLNETDSRLVTIGGRGAVAELDPGSAVRSTLELDWLPMEEVPAATACFDVGLAPLKDNPFNKAKSWLKVLEYSALGVPWIASDTPQYRQLAGAGVIARHPADWSRALRRLATSSAARENMAGLGREYAAQWTVERHAEKWLAAWSDAAARRGRMTPDG